MTMQQDDEFFNRLARKLSRSSGIRLDIACGNNKQKGFFGIDAQDLPGVDLVYDLNQYPWPLPDESVVTAVSSHYVEHINPADGGFLKFMDEVWRILVPEGNLAISTPYGGSSRYWQDPTHCNGCNEHTWLYFDPINGTGLWGFYRVKPWKINNIYWSPVGDIEVALEKRQEDPSYYEGAK